MEFFSCRTKIYMGSGSLQSLKELVNGKLLVVCDPFFMENGKAKEIASLSGATEVTYFADIKPDPDVVLAAKGAALVQAFTPDAVVAIGGGSTLDCAKAMLYFSGVDATLIAVPTTSGSGSEVTDFAILTHDGVKHPLVDEKLLPKAAILDGNLLTALPRSLIADGGFDAISHALEALVATNGGAITDALATDSFCGVYNHLGQSFAGNTGVRQTVHNASCMAGLAFSQAGLGLCHAMAHSLGGLFHVPHGRLNAMLLPSVVGFNAHVAGEKYAKIARAAGIGGSAESVAVRNLRNSLVRLRRELKLPETLAQAGVAPREVWSATDRIVEATLADPCCASNPMKVEDFVVRRILEEVTGRV